MKMLLETVSLRDIDVKSSPQVRREIHTEAVEDYSKVYKNKKPMPKATLCKVGISHYLVADGMHRVLAMMNAGVAERAFDVFQGSYEDCLLFAAGANQAHGVRRSSADKRTAIRSVLMTFPKKSNTAIAEIVGVTDKTVAEVRKELEKTGIVSEEKTRTGKDGKSYGSRSGNSEPEANGEPQPVRRGTPTLVEKVVDDMGIEVPQKALIFWNRRQEVQELMTSISRVKTQLAKSLQHHDPLYAEVSNTIIADLERVYGSLSVAKPYTVCPRCQGKLPDNCTTCSKRGLISKFYWDVQIDAETKKLREKIASKK
jgi:hypothetical protein